TSENVARVKLARHALADLERIFEFLVKSDAAAAVRLDEIQETIELLARHPLIARRVGGGRRELVISRGKSCYVALYRWWKAEDVVLALAIRHQREAGYADE